MARVLIVEGDKPTPMEIIQQIGLEGHQIRTISKPDIDIDSVRAAMRQDIALTIIDLRVWKINDFVREAVAAKIPHIIVHGIFGDFEITPGVTYLERLDVEGVQDKVILPLLADADADPDAADAVARISSRPSNPPPSWPRSSKPLLS
jgi:hypothetical protein